jgi:hypothetical protein
MYLRIKDTFWILSSIQYYNHLQPSIKASSTTIAIAAAVVVIVAVLTATRIAVDAKMSSESSSTAPGATTTRVV